MTTRHSPAYPKPKPARAACLTIIGTEGNAKQKAVDSLKPNISIYADAGDTVVIRLNQKLMKNTAIIVVPLRRDTTENAIYLSLINCLCLWSRH
jgi:hypothetical protein